MHKLNLTAQIKELVDTALDAGNPLLLAVVDAEARPVLSFRGSAHTFDDHAIGFWVRNTQGSTIGAIRANPQVALMYRSPTVPMLQFHGTARIATDSAERARVFERSPQREQDADPERKGIAVVVELSRIEGVLGFVDGAPQYFRLEAGGSRQG